MSDVEHEKYEMVMAKNAEIVRAAIKRELPRVAPDLTDCVECFLAERLDCPRKCSDRILYQCDYEAGLTFCLIDDVPFVIAVNGSMIWCRGFRRTVTAGGLVANVRIGGDQ